MPHRGEFASWGGPALRKKLRWGRPRPDCEGLHGGGACPIVEFYTVGSLPRLILKF